METTTVFGEYDRTRGKFVVEGFGRAPAGWDEMVVHFSRGSRVPRVREVLEVWIDVTTPYAMAPRDGASR